MLLPVLVFAAALLLGLQYGRQALRATIVLALLLATVRGGTLAIAGALGFADPNLTVNALVPALVAAVAAVELAAPDRYASTRNRWLIAALGLTVVVAVFDLVVQTVGFTVFGIGLAQYLIFPLAAIVAWPLIEPGDLRRGSRLLIGLGLLVSLTVFLQAAGFSFFVQAAKANVQDLAAHRFAGVTGSYLHTSAFLGVAAVLLIGEIATMKRGRQTALGSLLLLILVGADLLTFSRSGILITAIGMAVVFFAGDRSARRTLRPVLVGAVLGALVLGALAGVTPGKAVDRVASVFSSSQDKGNSERVDSARKAVDSFGELDSAQKAFGEGLGATGNGRQLAGTETVVAVESYYLKLLLEVGVFGLVLIGGFLVAALFAFASLIRARDDAWAISVGAAGLGLSLYNFAYPALETQILGITWWMLFVVCLRTLPQRQLARRAAGEMHEGLPGGLRLEAGPEQA